MRHKRPFLSALAAVVGIMLMLLDLWTLIAVKASVYRLWPGKARSQLTDPWLWFGALPLVALLLIGFAYWFGRDQHDHGRPQPIQFDEPGAGTVGDGAHEIAFGDAGKPKVLSGR